MTVKSPSAPAAITLLVAVSACSFIDRQIMSLLVAPIQRDLELSDTGVSLLLGLAFVVCYALAGPPIGLLVDRRPRWKIISLGIAFWSIATGACAFAGSYAQLFVCRMGVGAGEATLNPAGYSLIPDLVPRERLGLSIATFGLGVYAGAGLALLIGGQIIGLLTAQPTVSMPIIGEMRSWQAVFLAVGALGLPLAIIARFMPEPLRKGVRGAAAPSVREVLAFGRANLRIFVGVTLCWAGTLMAGYAVSAWFPTFMMRTHGWAAMDVGLWFGLIIVVFGATGAITGGLLSDWAAARFPAGRLALIVAIVVAAVPFAASLTMVSQVEAALALTAGFVFLQAASAAGAPTVLQDILPNRMRGLGSALAQAVTVLFGLGLGPTLVALVTDGVFGDKAMLGYALAIVIPLMLLGAAVTGAIAIRGYAALMKKVVEA